MAVPVWTAGLTLEDCTELERVKKKAYAIIHRDPYSLIHKYCLITQPIKNVMAFDW